MEDNHYSSLIQRINKVEELCLSLSTQLKGEIILRKDEDQKFSQLGDILTQQIYDIKNNSLGKNFNQQYEIFKKEICNVVDYKIKELNGSNIKSKCSKIDSKAKIPSESQTLNNIFQKLKNIENIYDGKIAEVSKKIEDIEYNNKILNNNINELYHKIEEINIILNNIKQNNFNENSVLNNEIEEKIHIIKLNIHDELKQLETRQRESNSLELNNLTCEMNYLKNDIKSLFDNYLNEIDKFKKITKEQNMINQKEISEFEQHILREFENFTKFESENINKCAGQIKTSHEFFDSDLNIIKNKTQYLEETVLKLREEIFESIENTDKYLIDKIHSYLNKSQSD